MAMAVELVTELSAAVAKARGTVEAVVTVVTVVVVVPSHGE